MTINEYENLIVSNYQNNLEKFKQYAPVLYNKLVTASDNRYSLELNINSLNISKDGELIYPYENVNEYFEQLLEAYYKRDKLNLIEYTINISDKDESIDKFGIETIALKHYANITKKYKSIFKKMPDVSKLNPYHEQRYAMMIFGIGLGYHIPQLIEKYEIQHLLLIDINIEMLRASLYTINWEQIFLYFNEKDKYRNLQIIIEENSKEIEKNIVNYLAYQVPMAYYNLAQMISYQNKVFEESIKLITNSFDLYTGTNQGFFDDEKWSLEHTLHNIKSQIPIYSDKIGNKVEEDKHVFVIGNGPSLDLYIDFIKENEDKAIIFSAGSALSSLYKAGIKIDYIIQMERTIDTYYLLKESVPLEYLKNSKIIGMNTLHPRVYNLFEKKFMFLKYSDAGAEFVEEVKFPLLAFTNPTVTNSAFRLALQFGFKNISFFGMDFGFKNLENHHSKNSFYYDKKSKFFNSQRKEGYMKVKGITSDFVYTERIINNSRKNIESLTAAAKEQVENIKIYNYSEGAYIQDTINSNHSSNHLSNVKKMTENEKEQTISKIESQFEICTKDTNLNLEILNERFDYLKSALAMFKRKNIDAFMFLKFTNMMYILFDQQFSQFKYIKRVLNGTFLQLLTKTYVYVAFQQQDKNSAKFLNECIDIIIEYMEDAKKTVNSLNNKIDRPF